VRVGSNADEESNRWPRMTKLLSFLLFLLGFVLANGFASSSSSSSSSSSTTGAAAASLHHQRVTSSSATTTTASSRTISSTCLDSSSASVEELSSTSSSANHHDEFVVSRENWELLSRRARSALSRLIRHDATPSSRGQQLHVYGDWPGVGVDDELKIRLGEQVKETFILFGGG